MKYHFNPNTGKIGICNAKHTNCPFGPLEEHFSTPEEAQECADLINSGECDSVLEAKEKIRIDKLTSFDTSTELFTHHLSKEIIYTKDIERRWNNYKGKITQIEKKDFPKFYKKLVADAQKKRLGKTPSKDEAFEKYIKSHPNAKFAYDRLKNFENETHELIEQRKQALEFFGRFHNDIIDHSFSNVSCSSYFLCKKEAASKILKSLKDKGYHIDSRELLEKTKGDNFLLRFSDHYPKSYLKRKNKKDSLWEHTDASALVMYKDVKLTGKFTKELSEFMKSKR